MGLEENLEKGNMYRSPLKLLEALEDDLPPEENYWFEYSGRETKNFGNLQGVKSYLEDIEENIGRYRDILPIETDSEWLVYREKDDTSYFGVEFPFVVLESDYGFRSSGKAGSISFGFVSGNLEVQDSVPGKSRE